MRSDLLLVFIDVRDVEIFIYSLTRVYVKTSVELALRHLNPSLRHVCLQVYICHVKSP